MLGMRRKGSICGVLAGLVVGLLAIRVDGIAPVAQGGEVLSLATSRCVLSVATFGSEGLALRAVGTSTPVPVDSTAPERMTLQVGQIVAVPELTRSIGAGTFAHRAGVLLTGQRMASLNWWTEPPSAPSVSAIQRGLPPMRQVVASTQRTGTLGRNTPRDATRDSVTYSLASDGRLVRRVGEFTDPRGAAHAMRGFADVRAMTLISRVDAYDLLLANLRDGRLITIRVPATAKPTPTRTLVRRGGWKQFDRLVAGPCGPRGTIVMGIDSAARASWMYHVGYASGAATPIRRIGRVPGAWNGPQTTPVVTTAAGGGAREVIKGG